MEVALLMVEAGLLHICSSCWQCQNIFIASSSTVYKVAGEIASRVGGNGGGVRVGGGGEGNWGAEGVGEEEAGMGGVPSPVGASPSYRAGFKKQDYFYNIKILTRCIRLYLRT